MCAIKRCPAHFDVTAVKTYRAAYLDNISALGFNKDVIKTGWPKIKG